MRMKKIILLICLLGFGSIFAADGDILFKDFNYDSKVDARFVQVAENKINNNVEKQNNI